MTKKLIVFFLVISLLLTVVSCSNDNDPIQDEIVDIKWSDITLGAKLPSPQSSRGQVFNNSIDGLHLELCDTSVDEYNSYVDQCKQLGYTVDSTVSTTSFDAYNSSGYRVKVVYYNSDSKMSISLDIPIEFGPYTFPDYANNLPMPVSKLGSYGWQFESSFFLRIGNTSFEDYQNYVLDCKNSGFVDNSYEYEKSYFADNSIGYSITLKYEGFNIMTIMYESPESTKQTDSTSSSNDNSPESTNQPNSESTANGEETTTPNVLTKDNNSDLKKLLELRDSYDSYISIFAEKYEGETIEFDGCVWAISKYENYDTRYKILIGAGNFDPNNSWGPAFRLTDVGPYDLGIEFYQNPETVFPVGTNVHIVAELEEYNPKTSIYELDIITITIRQ